MGPLMERTQGASGVQVGLIDGPVALDHPALADATVRSVSERSAAACRHAASDACRHGTLVAGVLVGARAGGAPAICPGCTLLVRPIFLETRGDGRQVPNAPMDEVAAAIVETIEAGAFVLNLSVALAEPSSRSERRMQEALDYAAKRGVIVVAAAGNQRTLGSSAITRHPWVIAVTACDLRGRPAASSNLSHSAGRWGVAAPGEGVISLTTDTHIQSFSGTSVAAPFVTGAVALLKSVLPATTAGQLRFAIARAGAMRRTAVVPPLLDGEGTYRLLSRHQREIAS
jgi:subtilisin family serine protease